LRADSNNCLSCKNSAYYLIEPQGTCQSDLCPSSTYEAANKICKACGPNCATCVDTENTCLCKDCDASCITCSTSATSCDSCAELNPYYWTSRKSCHATSCPLAGSYLSDSNLKICSDFNSVCATCTGPNNNDCLTCSGSLYYWTQRTSCHQTSCPAGEL
jgi:proprotein convertase subtilisin/kexin type 5